MNKHFSQSLNGSLNYKYLLKFNIAFEYWFRGEAMSVSERGLVLGFDLRVNILF